MSRSNNNSLSNGAQVGYIVEWFREWSELQREDFLPILAEKITANGVYINGVQNTMKSVNLDKPMSLFQCRIKLFNEWFPCWMEDDREKLLKLLDEVDDSFAEKLQEELSGETRHDEDFMIVPEQAEEIIPTRDAPSDEPEVQEEPENHNELPLTENGDFHTDIAVENVALYKRRRIV